MKNISFIALTRSQTLLVKDNSSIIQSQFQGFTILPHILSRWNLQNALQKSFQCSMSKSNKIRYHNLQFFVQMIKSGTVKISNKQFQESKVFSSEEKTILKQTIVSEELLSELKGKINNFVEDRQQLAENLKKKQSFNNASIVSFGEQLVMKVQFQERPTYIPFVLKNIDHYFLLLPNTEFSEFYETYSKIDITFDKAKYNLVKKRYEVQATFSEEIEIEFMKKGWGTVTSKNLLSLGAKKIMTYRECQKKSRTNNLGIFKKPFEILSFIYSKNNLIGVIQEVIEGYIYKVKTKSEELMKIELSMVYTPISNQLGAFESREFARRSLIGRQVSIFLKKDEGLNIHGSFVRFSDNKDIESLILQNGYGFVKQELKGSLISAKFQNLQKKAKQKKKGIHDESKLGQRHYEDLGITFNKKDKVRKKDILEERLKVLRNIENGEEGVLQKFVNANSFIIRVDSQKKLIKVQLDGVKKLKANPRLKQVQQLSENVEKFLQQNFIQRTVTIQINDYDKSNNAFIGILRTTKKGKQICSLQEILLSEGYVFIDRNGYYQNQWLQCQQKAEKQSKNIWSQNLKKLKQFEETEKIPQSFNGRFSWIKDGETAFVHPQSSYDLLDEVGNQLSKKMPSIDEKDRVVGYVCAAPYMGEYCRCKIITVNEKNAFVQFIDWGNKQTVPTKDLAKIQDKLQYIPPLSIKVMMDVVRKVTKNVEHLERVRQYMMQNDYKFVKVYGNIVNAYHEKNSLNMLLVEEGFLKAQLSKIHEQKMKNYLSELMDRQRRQLIGIWDVQDEQDSVDVSDDYDY